MCSATKLNWIAMSKSRSRTTVSFKMKLVNAYTTLSVGLEPTTTGLTVRCSTTLMLQP